MVKKTDVIYQTNSRGYDWIKVKPEYSDQMGEVSQNNTFFFEEMTNIFGIESRSLGVGRMVG